MRASAAPAPDGSRPLLAERRRLIGRHFYAYTRVRGAVAVTAVIAALFARYVLGMHGLDVGALTGLAGWILLYNGLAWVLFRRYRDPETRPTFHRRLLAITYGAVVLDFLALTAAIWLVGGGRSPFAAFYLLHVMVSCILLSRRAAITLTAFAYLLLLLQIVVEWSGLATPRLPVGAVSSEAPLDRNFALTLIIVYGMLFWLAGFLLRGMTRAQRRVDRRILLANAELERISEQRRGFLQIAAHNLKAPVGAVSMILDNMRAGLAGDVTEKQRDWLDRGLKRLQGLTEFMADLEKLSSVETDIIRAEFVPVDVRRITTDLVEEVRDIAEAHGHELRLEPGGPVPPVVGQERLLREAIVNYLTNAIKYTPPGGRITVRVLARAAAVRVEVTDTGIGVAPEDHARLFAEFVRLPTTGTRIGGTSGSGLGLSLVQRIVLAHGGRTGVDSEPEQGSTCWLELPALHE